MLRVAEHFARTDTGRQRPANEDAYFERSPLFLVADGMGGAQAGEVAARARRRGVRARATGPGHGRGAPGGACPRGQRAHPRARPGRRPARRHGHDALGGLRRRGRGDDRPRRRQPHLRPARRRADPPHARPLARPGVHRPRQAHRGRGRGSPSALDHHAGARPRAARRDRHAHLPGAARRRVPDLQRRPDLDGPRGHCAPDPDRCRDAARGRHPPHRGRQRGGRAGQHHGGVAPGRRGGAGLAETESGDRDRASHRGGPGRAEGRRGSGSDRGARACPSRLRLRLRLRLPRRAAAGGLWRRARNGVPRWRSFSPARGSRRAPCTSSAPTTRAS